MAHQNITTLNHPTRGPLKVGEVARMWDAIGARIKSNEREDEILTDLILKSTARRDKLRAEWYKLVYLA